MTASKTLLEDAQVRLEQVTVDTDFTDCEWCGAENTGHIGVYWDATDEPTGLIYACDDCVLNAVRTALDDAPTDSTITVEYEVHPEPVALGVAA